MRFQFDPFSPSGVSVLVEPKVIKRGQGYVGTGVREIIAGSNVTVNNTNPERPIVSSTGGSGSSPLTTKGDLYGYSTTNDRLPIGTDNYVLTADSGQSLGIKWAPATGGGSGITRSVSSVATATNAGSTSSTDYVYLVSGTTTITLPTAVGNTNRYTITNVGTNTVTVATTSAQTINGSASATLPIANMSLDFISDNANWHVE